MRADRHRLAPCVIRPRRLRKLIISTLAISTVVAIGCLHLAQRLHDRPFDDAAERRAQIAQARFVAKKYAYEGLPAWGAAHPEYPCPQRLAELDTFVGRRDTIDPWGLPFQSYCHSGNAFRVVSAGPDRTHGTYDDIIEGTAEPRSDR